MVFITFGLSESCDAFGFFQLHYVGLTSRKWRLTERPVHRPLAHVSSKASPECTQEAAVWDGVLFLHAKKDTSSIASKMRECRLPCAYLHTVASYVVSNSLPSAKSRWQLCSGLYVPSSVFQFNLVSLRAEMPILWPRWVGTVLCLCCRYLKLLSCLLCSPCWA